MPPGRVPSKFSLVVETATSVDLLDVCRIDERQIGSSKRKDFIEKAIKERHCLVARVKHECAGFAIVDQTFYEQSFIWLLIVAPEHRRKGIATELIQRIELGCPTGKLFTSTNRSNIIMQRLLDKLGFVSSGRIDNLDEKDPELVYFKRTDHENRTPC